MLELLVQTSAVIVGANVLTVVFVAAGLSWVGAEYAAVES